MIQDTLQSGEEERFIDKERLIRVRFVNINDIFEVIRHLTHKFVSEHPGESADFYRSKVS